MDHAVALLDAAAQAGGPPAERGDGRVHAEPGRRWTIASLAECPAMSRSSFALKFRRIVGASPMDYLTRWRMIVAADRLANSGESISRLAPALGDESESAFSTAFKCVMGCAPRHYGRNGPPNLPALMPATR